MSVTLENKWRHQEWAAIGSSDPIIQNSKFSFEIRVKLE